jgi:hypothetical protein
VTKGNIFIGIKELPFAGKKFSSKNIFAIILVDLVPHDCLCRNVQIRVQ